MFSKTKKVLVGVAFFFLMTATFFAGLWLIHRQYRLKNQSSTPTKKNASQGIIKAQRQLKEMDKIEKNLGAEKNDPKNNPENNSETEKSSEESEKKETGSLETKVEESSLVTSSAENELEKLDALHQKAAE
jgi:hypothetical protein